MARKIKDKEIKTMQIQAFGKRVSIQYIEEGENLIALEDSLIRAAIDLGCHSFQIEEIKVVNDMLYAYGKPIWVDKDKNLCVGEDSEKRNAEILWGVRYIVRHSLITPYNYKVSALGSAAIDNVPSEFRTYCPEIAERRARCRNILVAIGKKAVSYTHLTLPTICSV